MQRVEQLFVPAKNWKTSELQLTTEEMVIKILEELGAWFQGNSALVIKIMEDLNFMYDYNEHNGKRYWLINSV